MESFKSEAKHYGNFISIWLEVTAFQSCLNFKCHLITNYSLNCNLPQLITSINIQWNTKKTPTWFVPVLIQHITADNFTKGWSRGFRSVGLSGLNVSFKWWLWVCRHMKWSTLENIFLAYLERDRGGKKQTLNMQGRMYFSSVCRIAAGRAIESLVQPFSRWYQLSAESSGTLRTVVLPGN